MFLCFLNNKFYGSGDLLYMHELFKDYVLDCEMYGKDEVEFKVVKIKEVQYLKDVLKTFGHGED